MHKYLVIALFLILGVCKSNSTPALLSQNRQIKNIFTDRATYINLGCDKSSSYKTLGIESELPAKKCRYTIQPYNSYVCQVRIDIDLIYLNKPDETTGKCTDKLTINALDNFELCGTTVLSHLYVPLNSTKDKIEIEFSVGSNTLIALWMLRVTQLQCPTGSPRMLVDDHVNEMTHTPDNSMLTRTIFNDGYLIAPNGCLQYYPDPSGVIKSFNYEGGSYLPNMNYAICFRRRVSDTKLTLTGSIEMEPGGGTEGYDDDCLDATTDFIKKDYLFIPEAINEGYTRYCGDHSSVSIESSPPGPFVVYFHTDDVYDPATEIGYQLTYRIS